jgi:hypothetical protein
LRGAERGTGGAQCSGEKVGSLPKGYHGTVNTSDNNQEKGPGKRKRTAQKEKRRKDKKKEDSQLLITHYFALCLVTG